MGQRSAIVMFLFVGGGIMVPIMLLAVASASLGSLAIPVATLTLGVGFACLVTAKWPELRAGHFVSFGPRRLSSARRKLYWLAYIVLSCSLLLAAFAVSLK
jgi:hypothetical protein